VVEQLDRMIAAAETRRNTTLREIERHRSSMAARLREASHKEERATEAEFQVIDAPPAAAEIA